MVLDKYCPIGPLDWQELIEFLGAGDSVASQYGGRNRYHCSYVIYTDGTYYYAENGTTGELDYGGPTNEGGISGTSAPAVIQATLNQIFANGTLIIKKGTYSLGTTTLALAGVGGNFGIWFEEGAVLTYTGATYALTITATNRGDINRFSIVNPYISSSTGGGIQIIRCFEFEILHPKLFITGINSVALDLDDLNTASIYGKEGHIGGLNRQAGSIGVRLGATGVVNEVYIDVGEVAAFERGIQLGPGDYSVSVNHIHMKAGFAGNTYGIYSYTGSAIVVESWFEGQTNSAIYVNNAGVSAPAGLTVRSGSYFTEGATVYNIYVVNYQVDLTVERGVALGAGRIRLGANTLRSTLFLDNWSGTFTYAGTNVRVVSYVNGYPTENRGTQSITGAVNTVNVTHNMVTTPSQVLVTPLQQGCGDVSVSAKGAATFTINFANQPGGATWYFDWKAEA